MPLPLHPPQSHDAGRKQYRTEVRSATQAQYPNSTRPDGCSYSSVQHHCHHAGTSAANGTSSSLGSSTTLPSANSLTHLNVARHTHNTGKLNDSVVAHNKRMEDLDATLRGLGVELPEHIVARIAGRYTGATTMERFIAEECSWIPGYGRRGAHHRNE